MLQQNDKYCVLVCVCVRVCARSYVAGDGVKEAPLEEDEEDQPAKDAQQE